MEELSQKLKLLGITRTPTINELVKLVQKHTQRQIRGKQLAQQNPITPEKRALLLWAKSHKLELDNKKKELGAKLSTKTRLVNNNIISSTKYILPTTAKEEYSEFLQSQIDSSDFSKYQEIVANQQQNAQKLQNIINDLQNATPPKYLTTDMKIYVKRMLNANKTNQEIINYINSIYGRVPIGKLMNGKPPKGQRLGQLPPPSGITPINRKIKIKNENMNT